MRSQPSLDRYLQSCFSGPSFVVNRLLDCVAKCRSIILYIAISCAVKTNLYINGKEALLCGEYKVSRPAQSGIEQAFQCEVMQDANQI